MLGTAPLRRFVECLDGQRVPLNASQRAEIPGEYPYWGANGVIDSVGEFLFEEELVLLGEDGAPFDDPTKDVAFHVHERVWVNNHIHVLKPKAGADPRFLAYTLNSFDWMPLVSGSTRLKLTQEDMMSAKIPMMHRTSQRRTADYLDGETACIDALIDKKRKMMELLENRLKSLAEEVTVGRDGDLKTGIPSLPEIPSSWRVLRNKVFMQEVNRRSSDGGGEMLSVSHITGVTPRSEKTVYMFEAESTVGYKIVRPGDLVINTMWAWMGAAGTARTIGIVSPAYGVYTIDKSVMLPEYFDILVRTPAYVTEMTRFSRGVTSSRLRLYPDEFLGLSSPVPPIKEQREIAERYRVDSANTRAVCDRLARQIYLLRERRQALITAAVTGELGIPGLAA